MHLGGIHSLHSARIGGRIITLSRAPSMEPTPENIKAFQHARWRVKFTAHLLRLHESLETKGTEHWKQEQAEYLNRHALALESLAFYPPEWDKLYP